MPIVHQTFLPEQMRSVLAEGRRFCAEITHHFFIDDETVRGIFRASTWPAEPQVNGGFKPLLARLGLLFSHRLEIGLGLRRWWLLSFGLRSPLPDRVSGLE